METQFVAQYIARHVACLHVHVHCTHLDKLWTAFHSGSQCEHQALSDDVFIINPCKGISPLVPYPNRSPLSLSAPGAAVVTASCR
jgi:hypothetical protein